MKWISVFLLLPIVAFSQGKDDLIFYADVMRHADIAEHREWAAQHFKEKLIDVLSSEGVNREQRKQLRSWVSFLTPSDSAFSMITWQVNAADTVLYEGIIQLKSGKTIPLQAVKYDINEIDYDSFGADNWLAMLYYDLIAFSPNKYLLLGYNASQPVMNLKVAETLTISNEDVQFGHEWFQMDQDPVRPHLKNRIILRYDKRSSARMAYDAEMKTLFYDHVIPMETMEKKDEVSWVPDGSYEGFRLEGDKWMYVEKLFSRQVDTPPGVGKPQSTKKDILGRPVQK